MPRPLWKGAISFGLVTIPVKLYNAVSRKSVSFNQIDRATGARIKLRKVSAADGRELTDTDIAKGYEITPGQWVLVEPGELEAIEAAASRAIEIEEFVDLAEIDPLFYDSAYYVAPAPEAVKPYALLVEAMGASGRAAVARMVLRGREVRAALRPRDGHLVLSTLVYPDEIVSPAAIPELGDVAGVALNEREEAMARQLIDSLAGPFDPSGYADHYREQVLALLSAKAAGATPAPPPPAEDRSGTVVDLLTALQASVEAARAARTRHPTAHEPAGTVAAEDAGDGAAVTASRARPARRTKAKAAPPAEAAEPTEAAAPARRRAARTRKASPAAPDGGVAEVVAVAEPEAAEPAKAPATRRSRTRKTA